MQPLTLAKRAYILLFPALIAFYFYGIGQLPLVGPDEPRYAQVAREMFLRGDLVTPTLGGHTWFEKPALLYWMMIAAYKLFGVNEFSARVGSAVCGLLTIAAVWFVARELERRKVTTSALSFSSSFVLATSLGLIVFSRGASFDIVITTTITWCLSFFLLYEITEDGKRRLPYLLGFYVLAGLSLLAKGLIGIVIPFGVVAFYYGFMRQWPSREVGRSLLWGVPLSIAVSAIWYGPVISRHGWLFVDQFFIQHHFARYFSNKYHHPQPIYFYFVVLVLLTLPWTAYLVDALLNVRRWRWSEAGPINKLRLLALAWLVMPVVFFSFSGSKLPGYILPVLPAASLLIGERASQVESRWALRMSGVICLFLVAAGFVYAMRTNNTSLACTVAATSPLFVAGVFALTWSRWKDVALALIGSATMLTLVVISGCAAQDVAKRESVRDLLRVADARGYSQTPVFTRSGDDRTAEFYANGRVVYAADGEPVNLDEFDQIVAETRKQGGVALIIVPLDYVEVFRKNPQVEVLGDNGRVALLAIRVKS